MARAGGGGFSKQKTIGWNASPCYEYHESVKKLENGILGLFDCHLIQIVGNIYENPDLIGEE